MYATDNIQWSIKPLLIFFSSSSYPWVLAGRVCVGRGERPPRRDEMSLDATGLFLQSLLCPAAGWQGTAYKIKSVKDEG